MAKQVTGTMTISLCSSQTSHFTYYQIHGDGNNNHHALIQNVSLKPASLQYLITNSTSAITKSF